jgi:hypothetical protein
MATQAPPSEGVLVFVEDLERFGRIRTYREGRRLPGELAGGDAESGGRGVYHDGFGGVPELLLDPVREIPSLGWG